VTHDRYHRQTLLRGIGPDGQRRLAAARALLVGCGALGTVIAESLIRVGVGHLTVVDRDVVELTNLQRQTLFDESDARDGVPKSVAAKNRLTRINSSVNIDAIVADFTPRNAEPLAEKADVLIDGTDNFQTRYLLNDIAVKLQRPYIYGGAVGTQGLTFVVLPGEGPCLRCIFDEASGAGAPTCDTAGVLGPLPGVIANMQAAEAIKLLTGNRAAVNRKMTSLDLWSNTLRQIDVAAAYSPGQCVCCGEKKFEHLAGRATPAVSLCGRNAVQISPPGNTEVHLPGAAARLAVHATVKRTEHLVRADLTERGHTYYITLFTDGRAIIHGTDDPALARSLYAKYIGA
jgi:adenylyltransferase/sulfurtransferase